VEGGWQRRRQEREGDAREAAEAGPERDDHEEREPGDVERGEPRRAVEPVARRRADDQRVADAVAQGAADEGGHRDPPPGEPPAEIGEAEPVVEGEDAVARERQQERAGEPRPRQRPGRVEHLPEVDGGELAVQRREREREERHRHERRRDVLEPRPERGETSGAAAGRRHLARNGGALRRRLPRRCRHGRIG